MPGARSLCQEADPFANDEFHTIRDFDVALALDVPPDLDKIARCLRREDVSRLIQP